MYKFKVGDKVYKSKGYKFPGTVVSVFRTTSDEIRVVAELENNGMLHIFSESQLELQPVMKEEKEPFLKEEKVFTYVSKSDDLVPYHTTCGCTICNCIMGNKMIPNPAKYGYPTTNTTTSTSMKTFKELGLHDRFDTLNKEPF